jgi:hypothetical protein
VCLLNAPLWVCLMIYSYYIYQESTHALVIVPSQQTKVMSQFHYIKAKPGK